LRPFKARVLVSAVHQVFDSGFVFRMAVAYFPLGIVIVMIARRVLSPALDIIQDEFAPTYTRENPT
jgi:hypothetical protein